jgi:hypothetical protein
MAGTLTVDTIQSDSSYASTLNVASKINFTSGMQIGGQDTTFGGMRNRIINGDMRIAQRGTSAFTSTTSSLYTLDRWTTYGSGGSQFTVQQNAGSITPPVGFTNYLGVVNSATPTTPSGSQEYDVYHYIEGYNIADLGWGTANAKPVTLSFWVRSSITGTFGASLGNSGSSRTYPFNYTISSSNTWEQKTVTIPGDTSGTWLTDNGAGISLTFSLGAGSTKSGTANTWAGANYTQPTGSTALVSTASATWQLTGVQLEKGSAATAFENRSFATELFLCMRYFERSYDYGQNTYSGEIMKGIASFGSPHISAGASTNVMNAFMKLFLVPKRTQPTMTGYSLTDGVVGKWRRYYTGVSPADDQNVTFGNISHTGAEVQVASGGNCNIALGHWIANAEL